MGQSISDKVKFYESIFGRGHLSGNGRNFDVRCPICDPKDPNKKKLSIRTDNDACHCWVCGFKARTLAPLLRKFGTQSQLASYRQAMGMRPEDRALYLPDDQTAIKVALPEDFQLLATASTVSHDVKSAWKYALSRGLGEREIWYFKLGVSSEIRWRRRLIMPSHDADGNLNFFTARAIDWDRKPKYDAPEIDKNPIVFNDINLDWTRQMVLVEGPFDLVKCTQNTVPLLGSDLDERHEVFNRILLHGTPVALALDGDMWYTKMPRIVRKLQEYNIEVLIVDVRPWGDPGNMSIPEFQQALADAKPYTWEDNIRDKLLKASV